MCVICVSLCVFIFMGHVACHAACVEGLRNCCILNSTCLLSQLLSKVIHMLQFLRQMFDLFALLRDDPLKPVTPQTNGSIDETL